MQNRRTTSFLGCTLCLAISGTALAGSPPPFLVAEQAKLTASDSMSHDGFGVSVDVDGDTAIIGAPHADTPAGNDTGAAYILVRNGGQWFEQAKLFPSDGEPDDAFGNSVAISGETVVVGAKNDDTTAGTKTGSAYIFVRSSTTWTQQQKIIASDAAFNDAFGGAVTIFDNTAVVGAPEDDLPVGQTAGSAYVYLRNGTTWAEQAKLTASDAAEDDTFGTSVSVLGDTVVVGSPSHGLPNVQNFGAAYVFVRDGSGWSQQCALTAPNAGAGDYLGFSVAIDADTVVAGARSTDIDSGKINAGSAYVFARTGTTWNYQTELRASNRAPFDLFGSAVAIDANKILVGAPGKNNGLGAAFLFQSAAGAWTLIAQVNASDLRCGLTFGYSASMSDDTWLVGTTPDASESGEAYAFIEAMRASDCCRGDLDQNGRVDGLDIQPFVNSLLFGGECP